MTTPVNERAAVAWSGNPTYRLADSKIVEEWFFEDHLSLVRQLGLLPALA